MDNLQPGRLTEDLCQCEAPVLPSQLVLNAPCGLELIDSLDQTQELVGQVRLRVESATMPTVAIGEVDKPDRLLTKLFLNTLYHVGTNRVVVVQTRGDEKASGRLQAARDDSLDETVANVIGKDENEVRPAAERLESPSKSSGSASVAQDDPREVLARLSSNGGKAELFEQIKSVFEPRRIQAAIKLSSSAYVETRQDKVLKGDNGPPVGRVLS